MLTLAGVSDSGRPLVTSGIALVMPPGAVVMPLPAPVARNRVSRVNVVAPRPGAGPKVTYWLVPLRVRAVDWTTAVSDAAAPVNVPSSGVTLTEIESPASPLPAAERSRTSVVLVVVVVRTVVDPFFQT